MQDTERDEFEKFYWDTRGASKALRDLVRHPAQPQTYVQDAASRHLVTWRSAREALKQQMQADAQKPKAEQIKPSIFNLFTKKG